MNQNRGLTLLELIISLLIVSILCLSLASLISSSYQAFQMEEKQTVTEENKQFIKLFLQKAIHQAGYIGCPKLDSQLKLVNHTKYNFSKNNMIHGHTWFEAKTDQSVPKKIRSAKLKKGSDLLSLWYANDTGGGLDKLLSPSKLVIKGKIQVGNGDILIVSTCEHAEIVRVAKVSNQDHQQIVWLENPLEYHYKKTSQLLHLNQYYYFLAKNTYQKNKISYSLYMMGINSEIVEIVPNVAKFNLKFFEKGRFNSANNIQSWESVEAVQLLLKSYQYNFLLLNRYL